MSLRQYNYIYTGKNIDIINFKLNFNTLFFEAVPAAMGNSDTPSAKTGAAPDNGVVVRQNATPTDTVQKQQVPTPPTKVETNIAIKYAKKFNFYKNYLPFVMKQYLFHLLCLKSLYILNIFFYILVILYYFL